MIGLELMFVLWCAVGVTAVPPLWMSTWSLSLTEERPPPLC